jgi:hypothetical protein
VEKVVLDKFGTPGPPTKAIDDYLKTFYFGLLNNSAGLALQIHWNTLNPNDPKTDPNPYSWNYVQDAFDSVDTWNAAYPRSPAKTIQLVVSPGFFTPDWVTPKLTSCDGLFDSLFRYSLPTPTSGCGRVTFQGFKECGNYAGCGADMICSDCYVLPMPWDPTYKADWTAFLKALNSKYGSNSSLVSIAVAA